METEIRIVFDEIAAALPRFDDGRVDYGGAKRALVVTAPVVAGDEILLLKRSNKVGTYRGRWSTVAGYIDRPVAVAELVRVELREELGIGETMVQRVLVGPASSRVDTALGVDWVTVPALVQLRRRVEPRLDWEHTEYRWVTLERVREFDLVPGMEGTIERALALGGGGAAASR